MAIGKDKAMWVHTTHIIITMANIQRGKDDKVIKFNDVYPYSAKNTSRLKRERQPDELDKILAKASWEKLSKQSVKPKESCSILNMRHSLIDQESSPK